MWTGKDHARRWKLADSAAIVADRPEPGIPWVQLAGTKLPLLNVGVVFILISRPFPAIGNSTRQSACRKDVLKSLPSAEGSRSVKAIWTPFGEP
jgi:hypothetical protein